MSEQTHFGYREVPAGEKAGLVAGVFDSVSSRYDLMNDLMSGGMHRIWKRFAVSITGAKAGQSVLDVAGGTGDVARLLARRVGQSGSVILSDINANMLYEGRNNLINKSVTGNIGFVQADAENLCFPDNSFDVLTVAFGLRNMTDKDAALASMNRVLRPGGCLVILEFSKVVLPRLKRLYDAYSFRLLPRLGQLIAKDQESYQYLVESIRRHPDQETLKSMMEQAGFGLNSYYNLSGGIVAAHRGYKL